MVSLWGSKNDGDDQGRNGEVETHGEEEDRPVSRNPPSERRGHPPDERSRLLPRSPRGEGYLDPDDPAVSPYNLFPVRALRYLSVLFLAISFLWWVLLLVSIFVSPPGMHSRGSGFTDFSFTTLTVGNLLISLLFFSTPSKAMRICGMIISVFLLIDMIIVLAVARLRLEEGWVGLASVVWAAVIGMFNVGTDRVVTWGKKEEEERLTGRQETRRSLKEWCAVLTSTVIMIVLIIVTILFTATLILRSRDVSLAPPGERYLVDGDKYEVHLACVGEVTYDENEKPNPTVIVEAGEDPAEESFEDFFYNARQNGTIDRYCYWDRPGFAWSDDAPSPNSAGTVEDALSEALARAGEEGPWILASAGVGSIYSRIFSSIKGGQIKGILLIDPLHEDLLYQLGSPSRGFVLWARGIVSPLGLVRLFGAIFQGRTREDRIYGRSAYQGGKYIKAKLQENLVANSFTKREVSQARTIQMQDVPLVVVSSGIEVRKSDEWEKKQKDLTTITDELVAWDVVNQAPHEVWKTHRGSSVMEKRLGQLVQG